MDKCCKRGIKITTGVQKNLKLRKGKGLRNNPHDKRLKKYRLLNREDQEETLLINSSQARVGHYYMVFHLIISTPPNAVATIIISIF